jgi:uroporphyrinogen III methyltransferase/synthase
LDGSRELDLAIERLADYDWIVFTSPNGVDHFWRRMEMKGKDARSLYKLKIGGIGPKTALRLQNRGITADLLPDEYSTEGILRSFRRLKVKGQRILLPRANIAPSRLPNGLKKLGARVQEVAVYETGLPEAGDLVALRNKLRDGKIDIVTFTSSSTVRNFIKLIGDVDVGGARIACIGPVTASEAEKSGIRPDIVPQEYTIEGLVEEIVNVLSNRATQKA